MVYDSFLDNLLANWPIYVTLLILLAAILALIIAFAISEGQRKKLDHELIEKSNSIRIYLIDVPKEMVTYFNSSFLGKVKKERLSDFYQRFPMSEQKKVINWINALADPSTQAPDFLETDITDSSTKKQYFSLLQVDSIDRERGIIHLESYLLKYMATVKGSSSGVNTHGLHTAKELSKAIADKNGKKGISVCFRICYRQNQKRDAELDPVLMNQFKNVISGFLSKGRYLIQCSGNELLISDINATGKPSAMFLARSGLLALNRYLAINGIQSSIEARCGIVEHHYFQGDGDSIISEARRMAEIAYEEEENLVLYEKGRESRARFSDLSYRSEVERIISEKKINYAFRPIYSVKEKKVIGYFSKAEPKDTYFDSMEELKDYAIRTTDDRELFSTIARNTIPLFVSERRQEGEKLFYKIRNEEKGYMLSVFSKIPQAKGSNLVFLFDDKDFLSRLDPGNIDDSLEELRQIKAKGYDVAVLMEKNELILPDELYAAFDFFVCSFAYAGSASEMDTRIRAKLHGLAERLLKYDKPIIATDVNGWASIELLVRSGMTYVSSEDFSPFDPMILPLSSKAMKKIGEFIK